jgi:GNAT superfamily N-acetyltransferase
LNIEPFMLYRFASSEDSEQLALMNLRLIADEGHRNPMDTPQLSARMAGWLQGEYQAVLFEDDNTPVGYALFRHEPEYVYLRQLFVVPERRRQGIAGNALSWLWANAWQSAPRLRIDVLVGNAAGRAFWRSAGFTEYSIAMEASTPVAR